MNNEKSLDTRTREAMCDEVGADMKDLEIDGIEKGTWYKQTRRNILWNDFKRDFPSVLKIQKYTDLYLTCCLIIITICLVVVTLIKVGVVVYDRMAYSESVIPYKQVIGCESIPDKIRTCTVEPIESWDF